MFKLLHNRLWFLAFCVICLFNFYQLHGQDDTEGKPTKHGLIIAISDYDYEETGWHRINADNDAVKLREALVRFGFDDDHIKTIDGNVTKKKILSELEAMVDKVEPCDIVHFHYSGQGQIMTITDSINKKIASEPEFCLVPIDAYSSPRYKSDYKGENHISESEINNWINKIREIITSCGQVVVSYDACHTKADIDKLKSTKTSRGLEYEVTASPELAYLITFGSEGLASETYDLDGKPIGSWSYAFYKASLMKPPNFGVIDNYIKETIERQNPTMTGNRTIPCYAVPDSFVLSTTNFAQNQIAPGNIYMLSIGIEDYKSSLGYRFENCVEDAVLIQATIRKHVQLLNDTSFSIRNSAGIGLLNEKATKTNILNAINDIVENSQPNDFFIFNFSGYSKTMSFDDSKTSKESETFLYPYNHMDINQKMDYEEAKEHLISLKELNKLFDFIAARNQLIISEAGATPLFKNEFIRHTINQDPNFNKTKDRNRVLIIPEEAGLDRFICSDSLINNGPISYFLSRTLKGFVYGFRTSTLTDYSISRGVPLTSKRFKRFIKTNDEQIISLFNLFSPDPQVRKRTAYEIMWNEFSCPEIIEPYTSIFFERDYIDELQYIMYDEMQMRGANALMTSALNKAKFLGERHALLIGTSDYLDGANGWTDLSNPEKDVREIASILSSSYGYKTKVLINPSIDSLLLALRDYDQSLDSNDQFIFYMAGHGDYDPEFYNDGFLVFKESNNLDVDLSRNSYLSFSKIANILNNIESKQVLLFVDVCFGGAFDSKIRSGPMRGKTAYDEVDAEEFISFKKDLNTRIVLSSGSLNVVPDGYRARNSPFAMHILNTLKQKGGAKGFLTSTDLFTVIQALPSRPVKGELSGNDPGAEFILLPVLN